MTFIWQRINDTTGRIQNQLLTPSLELVVSIKLSEANIKQFSLEKPCWFCQAYCSVDNFARVCQTPLSIVLILSIQG